MSERNQIAGVDGCKNGWMVAIADGWPPTGTFELAVVDSFEAALNLTTHCSTVAVDMPIGPPAGQPNDNGVRQCDLEAKKLLGRVASRVFLTPPSPTLKAATFDEFGRIHRRLTGKGASRQSSVPDGHPQRRELQRRTRRGARR